MRIAVVTPIWKRPEVTRLCLRQWVTWQSPGIEFRFVVVGSEGFESLDLALGTLGVRCHYVEHPNLPLGRKFNAGIEAAQIWNPDYVMVMGSDMIVKDSIFAAYPFRTGYPFMGVRDMFIYDVPTAEAYYWKGYRKPRSPKQPDRSRQVIGPARMYSADLLEDRGWSIYPDDDSMNLDGQADRLLPAPRRIWGYDHKLLNIKTPDNITPTGRYRNLESVPTASLYFEGVDFTQLGQYSAT